MRLGQRFAISHLDYAFDAECDAARIIASPKCRHNGLIDDAIRDEIRQCPLEAAANFDAYPSILDSNEQQGAIVDTLTPELPGIDYSDRVLLDFFGCDGRDCQHGDLHALTSLERGEHRLELGLLLRREHSGLIGHPSGERGNRLDFTLGPCRRPAGNCREHARQQRTEQRGGVSRHCVGAGAPKSTVGAAEMAASFSTVKLGFTS